MNKKYRPVFTLETQSQNATMKDVAAQKLHGAKFLHLNQRICYTAISAIIEF
jgi:hypothetical protein